MCEIIPRSERSSEHSYEVAHYNFDADKVYRFEECDSERITEIIFIECNMPSFPKITNLHQFPNLKVFQITDSQLQSINKANLKGLEKIEALWLSINKLEYLPGDLLDDMVNLKEVSFYDNRIKYIDKELIQSLKNLEFFNFESNVNINRCYDQDARGSCSLEEIEKHILKKCKVPDEFKAKIKQQLENQLKDIIKPGGLLSDFKILVKNERTKDFDVTIQNHRFKVHKLLLMARSPLLCEMIENNPDAVELQLCDIPIDIFESILKFMYEDVLPPDDANFKDIFIAAGRLKIAELKKYAAEKLIEQVDEDNAFEYLTLANKYEHVGLRMEAFSQIKEMFPDNKLSTKLARDRDKILKLRELKKEYDDLKKKIDELNV